MPTDRSILIGKAARGRLRTLLVLVSLLAVTAPSAIAQEVEVEGDSIAVIERGRSGITGWDVARFPFEVAQFPLYLLFKGFSELGGLLGQARFVPRFAHYYSELTQRGIFLQAGGQGPNSGPGGGLLFRLPPGPGTIAWAEARGQATVRGYWLVEGRVGLGGGETSLVGFQGFGVREQRDEDEFFGIGNDTREADQSDFDLDRRTAGVSFTIAESRPVSLTVDAAWWRFDTGRGGDGSKPDLPDRFDPAGVPGFGEIQRYVTVGGSAGWAAGGRHTLLRDGTWAVGDYTYYSGLHGEVADFWVAGFDGGLEIPFDHRRRSLAFAVQYRMLREEDAGAVPFFLLPMLGGPGTLPAFRFGRFRDRDSVLGKAEYRFRVASDPLNAFWLDASVFANSGTVARTLADDFSLERLHTNYGFALTGITPVAALGRLEIANGRDGVRVNLSFGSTF